MSRGLFFIVVLLSLALSGCARTSILYNHLDWFVEGELQELFEAKKERRKELSKLVDDFHLYHRSHFLPRYAELIRPIAVEVGRNVSAPIDRKFWTKAENDAEAMYRETLKAMIEPSVDFLHKLDVAELDRLAKNLKDKFDEDLEMASDTDAQRRKRKKRIVQIAEFFVGDLSEQQVEMIDKFLRHSPTDIRARWVNFRREQQLVLLEMLKKKESKQKLRKFLTPLFLDPTSLAKNKEDRAYFEARRVANFDLVWQLAKSLNHTQRRELAKSLEGLASDFVKLSTST